MIVLRAPAKINWTLYVLGKRADGYHNIISLMQRTSLCDTLTLEESGKIELLSDLNIPPEQNLVFRAAELLKSHAVTGRGARITLKKEIPHGAGLGGGSSDAACTLMGLNELWGLGLGRDELKALALKLGSDVPFFFESSLVLVEGRGEALTPLDAPLSHTLLLVKPAEAVSTAWAYSALRREREGELTKIDNYMNNIKLIHEALTAGRLNDLPALVHNDFEEIVISKLPVIGEVKRKLMEHGAAMAIMSGSGAAVFGLFEEREAALSACKHFSPFFAEVVTTEKSAGSGK